MWTFLLIYLVFNTVTAESDDFRIVQLDSGVVRGDKYWNGDYYEFYGIPYASVPTGRNKFKGPEPVKPWEDELFANKNNILCHQCYYSQDSDDDVHLAGEDECLTVNVLVPSVVNETNLSPVVVYIHSGAFSGGSGNMAKFGYLARHDIVVVSFNYRVGAFGFVCLGNEEIPGNAGLKDQVAALRWIKTNIKNFGGDPDKITLAGFSVGAAMAELLALSKTTDGIINQLILESGSALSPFTINRDPVRTAWNVAQTIGYNGTASIEDLTEFYLNADTKNLAQHSVHFFLPNSTFGFSPCIEKVQEGVEAVVTESPLDMLKRGDYHKIPVLTGFSNMEGLSRTIKFGAWREQMNENFADFLPADLKFETEQDKEDVIKEIKQHYFDNKNVTHTSLARYIDYFSDAMFKYGVIKSAKLHAAVSKKPVYLYEFSYVGKLNIQHNYMDRIKGASHRDQTAYILDFFGFTNNYRDLDTRDRMTTMWTDYVQYGNPTEFESLIMPVKWPWYTTNSPKYLEINKRLQVKQGIFNEEYKFWDKIYEKYYWNPTTVKSELNLPSKKEDTSKTKSNFSANKPANKEIDNENIMASNENNKSKHFKRTTTIKKLDKDGKLVTKVIKYTDNTEEITNTNIKKTEETKCANEKIQKNKEDVQHAKHHQNTNDESTKVKTDSLQDKEDNTEQDSNTQGVSKGMDSNEKKKVKAIQKNKIKTDTKDDVRQESTPKKIDKSREDITKDKVQKEQTKQENLPKNNVEGTPQNDNKKNSDTKS